MVALCSCWLFKQFQLVRGFFVALKTVYISVVIEVRTSIWPWLRVMQTGSGGVFYRNSSSTGKDHAKYRITYDLRTIQQRLKISRSRLENCRFCLESSDLVVRTKFSCYLTPLPSTLNYPLLPNGLDTMPIQPIQRNTLFAYQTYFSTLPTSTLTNVPC